VIAIRGLPYRNLFGVDPLQTGQVRESENENENENENGNPLTSLS